MYAASVGATLLVILGAIWEKFVKLKFSEGFYNAYDKTGIVLIIVAMAVTALGSVVRDRVTAQFKVISGHFEALIASKWLFILSEKGYDYS